jgi:UDP-N-acetylmuramate--alanine ligase
MHIYFSGIGGSGLAPLSQLALDSGFKVSGSDSQPSLNTSEIEKRGIKVTFDQSGESLALTHQNNPVDWLVYTAGLPADHLELVFARKNGIRTSKRDELTNFIIQKNELQAIAVAGTHGKTTTTAIIAWLFQQLDLPISYLIGTNISFGPSAKHDPHSKYFVFEADEFDKNFLHFTPHISVITSLDFDHPDVYKSQEDYDQAFRQFINQSTYVVSWPSDLAKLSLPANSTKYTRFTDNNYSKETTFQESLSLKGNHFRQNAELAYQVISTALNETGEANQQNYNQKIINSINEFPGTQRRMEKLVDNLYTDYAHHPSEIQATIQSASESDKNIIVVYQPHQNIRQYSIMNQYDHCFAEAEKVYWLPTYLTREQGDLPVIEPHELISKVKSSNTIEIAQLDNDLKHKIYMHLKKGDTVVGMGAGSIDSWLRQNFKINT